MDLLQLYNEELEYFDTYWNLEVTAFRNLTEIR